MNFTKYLFFSVAILSIVPTFAFPDTGNWLFQRGATTTIYIGNNEKEVVKTAVGLLRKDVKMVTGADLKEVSSAAQAQIVVQTPRSFKGKWENFSISVNGKQVFISGSDARGKAYGILELSRMLGVSPWHYFADSKPQIMDKFAYPAEVKAHTPSVKYRGIFLNDEDWGLMPWATGTLAPGSTKGAIGPEAYEKIFELMLRLRANTIWPAMHECTVPFYFVKGNREMADRYGIVVGTSHCEPLLRSSATEWDAAGTGDYNFITNRRNVENYWAERLKELKTSENIYTIGMRGKHDGMMEGVKTLAEHKAALSEIIPAQQALLKKYINPNPAVLPQVFIPYKEVLDVYDRGLEVPDPVTLIWCDDNYGYIKRLSNEKEQKRSGGSGVYYHVSYWGRPHDYLWLATTSPALMYTEMKRAYEHGANRLWIVNVGDLKPAEYLTEYFIDLAWDIESERPGFMHLKKWMEREFGSELSGELAAVMKEYYRLAAIRKPEFMGWSRVEESGYGRGGRTPVRDTEYNPEEGGELHLRLKQYASLEERVAELGKQIPERMHPAYFQLVEYPVRGASLMNRKWLNAQLARHSARMGNELKARREAIKSELAYQEIDKLTAVYNQMEQKKWNRMMDFRPRSLPVFNAPDFTQLDSLIAEGKKSPQVEPTRSGFVYAFNASDALKEEDRGMIAEGLGHSFSAVQLPLNQILRYEVDIPSEGEYWIRIAVIPNHDVDGQGMILGVGINGNQLQEMNYKTEGRSESWKQNVLRGQALLHLPAVKLPAGKLELQLKALSSYVQIDQVMIGQGDINFYEFPVRKPY